MDGSTVAYKVLEEKPTYGERNYYVGVLKQDKKIGTKFETTWKNKKGDVRLLKCWVQLGDLFIQPGIASVWEVKNIYSDDTYTYVELCDTTTGYTKNEVIESLAVNYFLEETA